MWFILTNIVLGEFSAWPWSVNLSYRIITLKRANSCSYPHFFTSPSPDQFSASALLLSAMNVPVRSSRCPAASVLLARVLRQWSFTSPSCWSHLTFCSMTFLGLQNQESEETISAHYCRAACVAGKCSLGVFLWRWWGAGEKMDLLFSLLCSHCTKSAASPLAAQGVRDKVKEHLHWAFNEAMGVLPLKGTWKLSFSMWLFRLASSPSYPAVCLMSLLIGK